MLRIVERADRVAIEQRRRVRHRRIEPQPVEVVAQVVVRDDVLARASLGVAAQQMLEPERELAPPLAVERELERALVEGDDGEQRDQVRAFPATVHVSLGERHVAAGHHVAAKLPVADGEVGFCRGVARRSRTAPGPNRRVMPSGVVNVNAPNSMRSSSAKNRRPVAGRVARGKAASGECESSSGGRRVVGEEGRVVIG